MPFNNNGSTNNSFAPVAYGNIEYINDKGVPVKLNDSTRYFASKKVDNAIVRKHEGLLIAYQAYLAAGGKADADDAPPEGYVIGDVENFDNGVPHSVVIRVQLAGNAEDVSEDDV